MLARTALSHALPGLGLDPRLAALVGTASPFAGASHVILASAVSDLRGHRPERGDRPPARRLHGGPLSSQSSIMTRKIERRGIHVPRELGPMVDPVA
ncbi:MAG TPA: hypothetical protein VL049_02240 [Candidatus Dormibacteraeota bacterium]|nr:hypothetical protein [Candidatus Dormibacteraeota bacterium]